MFPSFRELFISTSVFWLFGLILVGLAVLTWSGRLFLVHPSRRRAATIVLIVLALPLMGTSFLTVVSAWYFCVEPTSIIELEFTELQDSQEHSILVFRDRAQITRAFRLLRTARAEHRGRESLSDGYVIRIKLEGASEFSSRHLIVYRKSSTRGLVAVVIPRLHSNVPGGTLLQGGEYSAPEFHRWLSTVIDPPIQVQ